MGQQIEYTAQAASPIVNGEVKMTISENALTASALFDTAEIPLSEINEIIISDYVVTVKADSGDYAFSRMGNWCGPFYDALCGAYNGAVLRSFFIKGEPIIKAKGNVPVNVYENCVASLPPDLSARRIPLCFISGIDKGDHELTLKLDAGESYTFTKLGYEAAPFAGAVEKQTRYLREQTVFAVKEIDYTLTTAQAAQLAKIMTQGAAASIGQLSGIASSFVTALENKLSVTRAAESYEVFKEACDPARIYIGFRKNEASSAGAESQAEAEVEADQYVLWLIAPSPDGQFAAVEFAEADTATFVYRTGGDFDGFAKQINRALEAIDFKREVIRLSDDELRKPENADYYMAAKRTAALQFIRSNFVGRVIHSSPETWKRKLFELWS